MGAEIATLFARIGADVTGLQTGLMSARNMLTGAGQAMQSAGMQMTMGLTVPLAGLGLAAAKAATDLDTQMRNIQSISKQSDADIAALSDRFVTLSTDLTKTRDSAVGLAAGFYQVQSSGFSGADAMKVLEASTKAASAGLSTTETAVKAITAVLNAYGMQASEATRVSDVLFKAVDIGIFDFNGIAGAIGDTLGAAAAAKIPIEQLAAAFATITKAGINVNEAATSINQLMLSYISPSKQAKEAAAALGIEMSAQALQTKGLDGVMKDLATHTQLWATVATNADAPLKKQLDTIKAQQTELEKWKLSLQSVGNYGKDAKTQYEQQAAALKLQTLEVKQAIETNVDYTTVMNKMAKATGLSVSQLAELFPNVRALRGALALTREGGAAFAEDLAAIAGSADATSKAFAEQTKSWAAQWDNFKNTATAALIELGQTFMPTIMDFLKNGVVPLINSLRTLDPEWIKWAVGVGAVLIVLGPVISLVGTLLTTLGFLMSPIGLIIAAVGLLALAFSLNLGGIRDTTLAMIQPIKGGIDSLISAFTDSIPMLQAYGQDMFAFLLVAWNQYGPPIVASITQTLTTLAQFWRDHGYTIMSVVSFAFRVIVQTVGGFMLLVTTVIQVAMAIIDGVFNIYTALMQGNWQGALNALLVMWITVWTAIINFATTFANNVCSIVGTNLDAMRASWAFVFSSIWIIITTTWNQIMSFLGAGLAAWGVAWNMLVLIVQTVLLNLAISVMTWFMDFIATWQANWDMAVLLVTTVWANIVKTISDYITAAITAIIKWVFDVIGQFNKLVADIKAAFSLDWGAIGSAIIEGIKGGVTAAAGALAGAAAAAARDALAAAKAALGIQSPSKAFALVGKQMMAGMAIGVSQNAGMASGATQQAANQTVGLAARSQTPGQGGGQDGTSAAIQALIARMDQLVVELPGRIAMGQRDAMQRA